MIIQGTKDEIVPIEPVKEFAENSFLDFIAVEEADHRFHDPKKMDEAILQIETFFADETVHRYMQIASKRSGPALCVCTELFLTDGPLFLWQII